MAKSAISAAGGSLLPILMVLLLVTILLCSAGSDVDAFPVPAPAASACRQGLGIDIAPCNISMPCCTPRSVCKAPIDFHMEPCRIDDPSCLQAFCCLPVGTNCSKSTDCCGVPDVLLTMGGVLGSDHFPNCDSSSAKCCAPVGAYCENHTDCCPAGPNKRGECYQAGHKKYKYCRAG